MSVTFFYTDYRIDKHIRSDEAQEASLDSIITTMTDVLNEPDNFVGIIDANNTTLQFMVEDDGSILVDIPVHDQNGSHTKSASLAACIEMVKGLADTINIEAIEGLEFKQW